LDFEFLLEEVLGEVSSRLELIVRDLLIVGQVHVLKLELFILVCLLWRVEVIQLEEARKLDNLLILK